MLCKLILFLHVVMWLGQLIVGHLPWRTGFVLRLLWVTE